MNGSRPSSDKRHGIAAVELAACAPVIVLIVFASIEACSLIFLQEALQTTAYETARFAVAPRSTTVSATDRGEQILSDRNIRGATIDVDPVDVERVDRGEQVVVTVDAPLDENRILPAFFYGNQTLTAEVTMLRE